VNIILFGPPGAGKGTQAKYLVKKLNAFQISTGEILREEIKKDTEIGKKISYNMSDGKFVSDEIVNNLIKDIVFDIKNKDRLIFDGYPRSLTQAKNLNQLLDETKQKIDFIFFLNVNKETILNRIKKRKVLENRSDDDSDTIIKRYDTYMKTTKPVLDYYSKNQNFKEIDGSLEIDEITRKIDTFINV
jgi:adenylate kinase